jgi:hypothetical protein
MYNNAANLIAPDIRLITIAQYCVITGDSRSRYYADAAEKLAPRPIKDRKNSRLCEHEARAMAGARAAGKSDEERRAIVRWLEAQRASFAPHIGELPKAAA